MVLTRCTFSRDGNLLLAELQYRKEEVLMDYYTYILMYIPNLLPSRIHRKIVNQGDGRTHVLKQLCEKGIGTYGCQELLT